MIKEPLIKFLFVILFILSIITVKNGDFNRLLLHLFLISFFVSTYKIKLKEALKKLLNLLPFILFYSVTLIFVKKYTLVNINIFNLISFNLPMNFSNFISVVFKSIISLFSLIFIIQTSNFANLIKSLSLLGIPKEILNTTILIYRYFFVLLDEIKKMEISRDLRYFGGYLKRQIVVFSNIIGVLLIRSIERSERIYNAMIMRGYEKDMKILVNLNLNKVDLLLFSFLTLTVIIIRII